MSNRDFEEWYSGTYHETIHILPNGQYASLRQQHSWDAWQAQKAKIDELQTRIDEALTYLRHTDFRECKESILFNILKAVEK